MNLIFAFCCFSDHGIIRTLDLPIYITRVKVLRSSLHFSSFVEVNKCWLKLHTDGLFFFVSVACFVTTVACTFQVQSNLSYADFFFSPNFFMNMN